MLMITAAANVAAAAVAGMMTDAAVKTAAVMKDAADINGGPAGQNLVCFSLL
jgi:archaellum component FlaG (FlaF/FlaG flagellin family)